MYDCGPLDIWQQMAKLGGKFQPCSRSADPDCKCIEGVPVCLQPAKVSQYLVATVAWLQSGEVTNHVA